MQVISFTELFNKKYVVTIVYCFSHSIISMRLDDAYMHLWIE